MEEEWRDIQGYEGLYQVSNLGNVKSLPRWRGGAIKAYCDGRILARTKLTDGYLTVWLFKDGNKRNVCVQRLVAAAFLPNPLGLRSVTHIDGDKTNNRADNLEWCNRGRPVARTDSFTGERKVYRSVKEAAEDGFVRSSIINCLKGRAGLHYGYRWEYAEEGETQCKPRACGETNTTQGEGGVKMAMAKVDDELTKLTRLLAVGFGCAGPETRTRWEVLRIEKVGETDCGGIWELKIRAMPKAQPKQEAENDRQN